MLIVFFFYLVVVVVLQVLQEVAEMVGGEGTVGVTVKGVAVYEEARMAVA